jgi:serine/threonine protein kinase
MEYCQEGTLKSYINGSQLEVRFVRRFTAQMLLGLEFLHLQRICHRDIKPDNVFLTRGLSAKLGDFGSVKVLSAEQTATGELKEMAGTLLYSAPEVVIGQGYGRYADIWALGCVVLEMSTGQHPYRELPNRSALENNGWIWGIGMGYFAGGLILASAPAQPSHARKQWTGANKVCGYSTCTKDATRDCEVCQQQYCTDCDRQRHVLCHGVTGSLAYDKDAAPFLEACFIRLPRGARDNGALVPRPTATQLRGKAFVSSEWRMSQGAGVVGCPCGCTDE